MLLAIFRDIFSKNRLFFYLFSLILAIYFKCVGAEFSSEFRILLLSTLIVTTLSTFQLLYSYFSADRMEGYFQLPISLSRFKISFLFATFILNFFERIVLLLLFFNVTLGYGQFIELIAYSILVILSVFYIFMKLNTRRQLLIWLMILGMFGINTSILLMDNMFYMLICSIMVFYFIMKDKELIYISKKEASQSFGRKYHNYFVISLLQEKYFFINTIFTLLVLFFILFQDYTEQLKLITLFTVSSVNTPLTSLISADKDLIEHIKTLPHNILFFFMYFRVLVCYYLILNLSLALISKLFILNSLSIHFLLLVIGLAILEAVFYLGIEIYFPLRNWNLKRELWKHPRKYIVPIVVFLVGWIGMYLVM